MKVHEEIDLEDDDESPDGKTKSNLASDPDTDTAQENIRALEREAIGYLNMHRQASGMPALSESEERAILHWIVEGGRVPDHLQLDKRSDPLPGHTEGLNSLLFALAELENLRTGRHLGEIILEIMDRVVVTIESPHELQ